VPGVCTKEVAISLVAGMGDPSGENRRRVASLESGVAGISWLCVWKRDFSGVAGVVGEEGVEWSS
jgi:hypothetical protein